MSKTFTKEHRNNLSLSRKGSGKLIEQRYYSNNRVVNTFTIDKFIEMGFSKQCIYTVIAGKQRAYKNFKFNFLEN